MAQGQTSQAVAPDTLPGDFFDKKNAAPDVLPADFFDKKRNPADDPEVQHQARAARSRIGRVSADDPIMQPESSWHRSTADAIEGLGGGIVELGKDTFGDQPETGRPRPLLLGDDSLFNKYVGSPAKEQFQKAKESWASPGLGSKVESGGHALAGALPVVGPMAAQAGEDFGKGDVGAGVVDTAAALAARKSISKPLEAGGPKIAERLPSKGDIGTALRTENGGLKPGVKGTAKLLGATAGHLTGIPSVGTLGGFLVGPSLADMLIPDRPMPELGSPENPGWHVKIPGRVKVARPTEIQTSPFQGMTPSSASGLKAGSPQLPAPGESSVSSTALTNRPMSLVESFKAPEKTKSSIIDPNNIPTDEVTHQSVPWAELKAKAMRGDKFAIDEVIRRGREAEIPGLASAVSKNAKPYPRIGR